MEGGVKELSLYRLSRAKEDLDSSKNDLCKGFLQVNITAGIFICSKQSRSNHYMMFRSVHVAERLPHHPVQNFYRTSGSFCHTDAPDHVHTSGVTFITDIMAFHTSCSADLPFMADGTFRLNAMIQIFKRLSTDQTFIVHWFPCLSAGLSIFGSIIFGVG